MKRRWLIPSLLLAAVFLVGGCQEDDSPAAILARDQAIKQAASQWGFGWRGTWWFASQDRVAAGAEGRAKLNDRVMVGADG